jgi:murein DD-endopeptidase MepM/ murein hydrolase activator NlpD
VTTAPPTARRTARSALAALLGLLLAGPLVLAGAPASAQPRQPAAPATAATAAAAAAAAWSWPLDATGGAPEVLRPASLPERPWQVGHRGVDLAAAPGQAVLAPVDGVVVTAGRVAGRGVVSIRSASGWRATLEPVDAAVTAGQVVSRGQVVGSVSAPGAGGAQHCAPPGCLHWGVRTGSGARVVYRDPLSLLRRPVRLLPVPGWAGS